MRITILSLGSRGDVQPFIALAVGMQKTGRYKVRFAAPDNFESLARDYSLTILLFDLESHAELARRR